MEGFSVLGCASYFVRVEFKESMQDIMGRGSMFVSLL